MEFPLFNTQSAHVLSMGYKTFFVLEQFSLLGKETGNP